MVRRRRLQLFLILFLLNYQLIFCKQITATFSTKDASSNIQHFVYDEQTGQIFVGATNNIFQLQADTLDIVKSIITGPQLDSPYCSANGKDCIEQRDIRIPVVSDNVNDNQERFARTVRNDTRVLTDNVNKILQIYNDRRLLISCGSIRQGVCNLYRMEDITKSIEQSDQAVAVAANSVNASTVAFIVQADADSLTSDGESMLFVAATYTYEPYRDAFPAVRTRTLSESRPLQLVDAGDVSGQSGLLIRAEYRSDYRVNYVGGFHSNGFAFWAAVQKKSPTDATSTYVSKLIRVCTEDKR
jgi:hypothetical protein